MLRKWIDRYLRWRDEAFYARIWITAVIVVPFFLIRQYRKDFQGFVVMISLLAAAGVVVFIIRRNSK